METPQGVRYDWSWPQSVLVVVAGLGLTVLLAWLQPHLEGAVYAVEIGFVVAVAEGVGVGAGIVAAAVGLFTLADLVTPNVFSVGPLHATHLLQLVIYAAVSAAVLVLVAIGRRTERHLQVSHATLQATNARLQALSDVLAPFNDAPLDVGTRADLAVRQLCRSFARVAVMTVQVPSLGGERVSWAEGRETFSCDGAAGWIANLPRTAAFRQTVPIGNSPLWLDTPTLTGALTEVGCPAATHHGLVGACTRLNAKGRPLGTLWVLWPESLMQDQSRSLAFVADLGTAIAVGLDNAERYREAVSAIQDRDTVLAAVSHDLKNPLNAIRLSVDVLQKAREERPEAPASPRLLQMIDQAVRRMTILIRDLLDQARSEASALRLAQAETSVVAVLNEAVAGMAPQAEEHAQTLDLTVAPDLPAVWADRDRLLQVLSNLIGNACKFSPAGARIRLFASAERDMVRCCVADSGPGIAPEDLPHIFERFWQANPTTGTAGSGLGLSIARSIIEAHGGRIWAESAAGQGTLVCFTVPQARPQAAPSPRAA